MPTNARLWAHPRIRVGCLVLLCSCCGCGSDLIGISGTVTADGEPVTLGTINFRPDTADTRQASGTKIEEGQFALDGPDGLVPGSYQVTIRAFRATGREINDPQMGPIPERVEINFRERGQLTADVSTTRREFHFELSTK